MRLKCLPTATDFDVASTQSGNRCHAGCYQTGCPIVYILECNRGMERRAWRSLAVIWRQAGDDERATILRLAGRLPPAAGVPGGASGAATGAGRGDGAIPLGRAGLLRVGAGVVPAKPAGLVGNGAPIATHRVSTSTCSAESCSSGGIWKSSSL